MNTITRSADQIGGPVRPVGQVKNWIANLREVAEQNDRLAHEIEERLNGVVTPEPPLSPATKDAPNEPLVETADNIRQITQSLDRTNNRLRSLLGRIEL